MIIRNYDGNLVEININDFLTDLDYYKEVINLIKGYDNTL